MIFPMATKIVAPQADIVELILVALQMPDKTQELVTVVESIRDRITPEQYNELWSAAMIMLNHAQDTAFRLGWEMRGQV